MKKIEVTPHICDVAAATSVRRFVSPVFRVTPR